MWEIVGHKRQGPFSTCNVLQRKLNEPEKDLTYKLELPVQMYELQVN